MSDPVWQAFLDEHPEAHLLQSAEWGELKSAFGWQARPVMAGGSGALVLLKPLPLGLKMAYIPRGPVGSHWAALLPALDAFCRRERAVFLKVEPDAWEPFDVNTFPGLKPSSHAIQPRRTVVLSLEGSEEDLLARMKQKTRYNIRLAAKKEVAVAPSSDLEGFSRLMDETGQRDGFGVHNQAYYRKAYDLFHPRGACELLLASFEGRPLAALMVFCRGPRAWYFYGASSSAERNRMPTYLLQWEAMRWARERGCKEYDLWGVPDVDEGVLEQEFTDRREDLWGVYRFKRGFGGSVLRSAGALDRVYNPPLYALYRWWAGRRAQGA
ncbi:MAG TPA: peptidoglycan bridge formation glycyltransferase FemA/FemB family protein [Anaerolineaceae bacterium]|nr:peptidoglycan bridge formation glycyltransferase FemA/FemB family protein [Anaerolineaceae bacterium]HPN53023.1 peptidoglycan bridge formation glycyltransferase FemA/FemB family protein [Anaerolineaceae bacterium]